jgi:hypothetical protein
MIINAPMPLVSVGNFRPGLFRQCGAEIPPAGTAAYRDKESAGIFRPGRDLQGCPHMGSRGNADEHSLLSGQLLRCGDHILIGDSDDLI